MSKGLDALESIKHTTNLYRPNELNGYKEELDTIETELKVLEIIKKSIIAMPDITQVKTPIGNFIEITLAITKKEYDLLKEVVL